MSYRAKKHHIVPEVLQKQFLAMEEKIWFSEQKSDGAFSPPQLESIKKAFMKKNYNTITKDGEKSDVVEREFYGKIDNFLGKVIPDIFTAFEGNKVPMFSEQLLDSLRNVVMEMAKRTPDFTGMYDDTTEGKRLLDEIVAEAGADGDKMSEDHFKSRLGDAQWQKEFARDVRVRATIKHSPKVQSALNQLTFKWVLLSSKCSFILSSQMVYRLGNGGPNGLNNPNFEMWMPISPKIALVLLRDNYGKLPLVHYDTPDHVREINEYALKSSFQIGSHSRELLESLTGRKAVEPKSVKVVA